MQSQIPTFFSATTKTNRAGAGDILETKAIAEYERDRKRAHKGEDVKRKVVHTNPPNKNSKSPAWKRAAGDDKERRVLTRLSRDILNEREDVDQWLEEPVGADEDDAMEKENRPSSHSTSVRLEDLVVKPAGKAKKHSRPLVPRPATPRQFAEDRFIKPSTDLLLPLMDTIPHQSVTDVADAYDDLYFEFSSPDSDDWTVAATADGCLRYTARDAVASPSSATTVLVMPCDW